MKLEVVLDPFVFTAAHRGLILVVGRRVSGRTTLIKSFLTKTSDEWPHIVHVGDETEYDGITPRIFSYACEGAPVEQIQAWLEASKHKYNFNLLLVMENVSWNTLGSIRPLLSKYPNKLCVIACVEVCGGEGEEEELTEAAVEMLKTSTVVFGTDVGPSCTKILEHRAGTSIEMLSAMASSRQMFLVLPCDDPDHRILYVKAP